MTCNDTTHNIIIKLQQYLPLAVLKLRDIISFLAAKRVATVLTACGIETKDAIKDNNVFFMIVATVLTACGIETGKLI